MTKNTKVISEASGIFPILQEKKVYKVLTDKYPVWDNIIGREEPRDWIMIEGKWVLDPKQVSKTVWKNLSELQKLKFVDITIGGPFPALILKSKDGELALMTIAHFRNLVKARKVDLTDGMISGIFQLVRYEGRGDYYWYVEVV